MKNKSNRIIKVFMKCLNCMINFFLMTFLMTFIFFTGYRIYDSYLVVQNASHINYTVYKPTERNFLSFAELKSLNNEIFGWITIEGTNIDYPLVQSYDNKKYLTSNYNQEYSLSGAIFLDCKNNKNFTDFNNIIYGHNMSGGAMFGDLKKYKENGFLDEYSSASLFFNEAECKVQFFSFMLIDAYEDIFIYSKGINTQELKKNYLKKIQEKSLFYRDINVSPDDNLVVLSTCTDEITNGRHLLIGKIEKDY